MQQLLKNCARCTNNSLKGNLAMAYVADLHIHSKYSRACSKELNIPNLAKWAKHKGVDLLGTGDFLHPVWREELKKELKELDNGLLECDGVKFLLSCEISCIYSDKGKVRRIHLLIFLPDFKSVDNLGKELKARKVNLSSDGRPIMGLTPRDVCQITFGLQPSAIIIPAHVWTPWFGLYGSQSGYDSFQDCFEDWSDQIYAVETGLSSQPAMNWRISELDNKAIVSFSDAHSLPNLGREATIFEGELSYNSLSRAIAGNHLAGTIEFFPEEGKYHYSGHRSCGVVFSSDDIKTKGEICPVCGRRLTIGVVQRVGQLAARSEESLKLKREQGVIKSGRFPNRPGFQMLVALEKIIAEALHSSPGTVKVRGVYNLLLGNLRSELEILTKTPLAQISKLAGEKIAEGIGKVRRGEITIEPGFDNTYGKVSIWV